MPGIPRRPGRDYDLPPALARPSQAHREDLSIVTGMDRTFAGGTGVHAQAGACWLTSSPPDKPLDGGFPYRHLARPDAGARELGRETMLPSLELSTNNHTNNKETKYFESVSWYGPGNAASVQKNPRDVFDRLFRTGSDRDTKSVLDTVLEEARRLRHQLGNSDQEKLDEYLESVRATESQIERAEKVQASFGDPPSVAPKEFQSGAMTTSNSWPTSWSLPSGRTAPAWPPS